MYLSNLVLVVTAFTGLVTAGPPPSWNQWPSSASTSSRCYTKMGTTSVPWASSTSWSTKYNPCTTTTTVVSTVTSAAPSSTITTTVTTTTTSTAPTSSSTSTVTATATSTTSTTSTAVTTTTTTTTATTTATSTVPTSPGFIPIQTSLPGADCDTNCGADPVTRRRRRQRSSPPSNSNPSNSNSYNSNPSNGNSYNSNPYSNNPYYGSGANTSPNYNQSPAAYGKNKYQQGVTCYQYQSATCSTSTVYSTITVQGMSTGTVTSTTTSTITSTVVPSATVTTTTTTTTTTTSTATTTSTSTSTSTTTSVVSTTTVYAACATNNLADQVNGINIQSLQPTSNTDTSGLDTLTDPTSAYECCVAAITDPNVGEVFEFLGNVCLIFNNNGAQCTASDQVTANIDSTETTYIVAGNAYCGEVSSTAGS